MKHTLNSQQNTNPEVRAFIYQQLTDLEGLLPQNSNVSIVVEDPAVIKKTKKAQKKKVMIQLETEVGNLVVESEHIDIYKAIQAAKENLRSQLSVLQAFTNAEDRTEQINNIIGHKYLH
jgi:ribosome-associated translation inhibitor RaiA